MSLTIYPAIVVLPSCIQLTMGIQDATSAQVRLHLEMRTADQEWGDVDILPMGFTVDVIGGGGIESWDLFLPLNMRTFYARARAQDMDTMAYTDWYDEMSYVDDTVIIEGSTMNAQTIPYEDLRSFVCDLRGVDHAELTQVQRRQLAAWILKAYRYAYGAWKWPEAWVVEEKSLEDGRVLDFAVGEYLVVEAYTEDPRLVTSTAERLVVVAEDDDGLWLNAVGTTVWLRYMPRPPTLAAANMTLAGLVPFGLAVVAFCEIDGNCYRSLTSESLGSDYDDPEVWEPLPLLWLLADATATKAAAYWFTSLQEHAQAATLSSEAERMLNALSRKYMPHS